MTNSLDDVLLYEVDGLTYCQRCFSDLKEKQADQVTSEVSMSTLVSLSTVLDDTEYACSACGQRSAEILLLRIGETEGVKDTLDRIPARCTYCGGEDILAEFEESEYGLCNGSKLMLRKWLCLTCNAERTIEKGPTIVGKACHSR